MNNPVSPLRGEIWNIRFDPSEGDEIRKVRPAIVIGVASAGRMQLKIVVPITGWQESFLRYFWMIKLVPSEKNGLAKISAADTFQVKSISTIRFQHKLGIVTPEQREAIVTAIALCIGYMPPE